jgi:ABC-type sugar transport system substrate-binding protein
MRKSIAAVALVAAASLAVAGLAPAASAEPNSKPAANGVDVAKGIVAKYSKNPTSIGNFKPITKKIPRGKYVITITNATDAAITLNKYTVQGGKLLGWKMEALQAESTLEGQRKTLQQAIAKKPDGIAVSGMETDSYGDLYKDAEKKGIVIICSACMSRPLGALKDTHIAGPKMLDLWGQMIAAFTVANVKGTPNVQMFGISVYPILRRFDTAYQNYLKRLSPNAKWKYNELDFATGVPQQVGNVYKANKGTNMVTSDLGDFFIGVPQGLFNVGAKPGSAPLIGGLTAGKDAIQTLKNKTTNAWTAYSLPIVGYSVIDSFARYWTGTPFNKGDLPTQILTQKNIRSAVITSQGDYLGVKDFQNQFKKVWGIK